MQFDCVLPLDALFQMGASLPEDDFIVLLLSVPVASLLRHQQARTF